MITSTKRNMILKDARLFLTGGTLTRDWAQRTCSRYHIGMADLRSALVTLNTDLRNLDVPVEPKTPRALRGLAPTITKRAAPKALTPDIVKRSIVRGFAYKEVLHDEELGDDTFVIATLGQFRREREALHRWLEELGVDVKALLK